MVSKVALWPVLHVTSAKAPNELLPSSFKTMLPLSIGGSIPQSAEKLMNIKL
jgi:hypothetical protein